MNDRELNEVDEDVGDAIADAGLSEHTQQKCLDLWQAISSADTGHRKDRKAGIYKAKEIFAHLLRAIGNERNKD